MDEVTVDEVTVDEVTMDEVTGSVCASNILFGVLVFTYFGGSDMKPLNTRHEAKANDIVVHVRFDPLVPLCRTEYALKRIEKQQIVKF